MWFSSCGISRSGFLAKINSAIPGVNVGTSVPNWDRNATCGTFKRLRTLYWQTIPDHTELRIPQDDRLAQKDLKWTINICTHFFHQRGKQPRFLVFQKILRTSHDFAQNHVGGALFDVSKVGLSTLKIKRMRVFQPSAKNPD